MDDNRALHISDVWECVKRCSPNPSGYIMRTAEVRLASTGKTSLHTVVVLKAKKQVTWVYHRERIIVASHFESIKVLPITQASPKAGYPPFGRIPLPKPGGGKAVQNKLVLTSRKGKVRTVCDSVGDALVEIGYLMCELDMDLTVDPPAGGGTLPDVLTIYRTGKHPILSAVAVLQEEEVEA